MLANAQLLANTAAGDECVLYSYQAEQHGWLRLAGPDGACSPVSRDQPDQEYVPCTHADATRLIGRFRNHEVERLTVWNACGCSGRFGESRPLAVAARRRPRTDHAGRPRVRARGRHHRRVGHSPVVDLQPSAGHPNVACFLSERAARHIVDLHNAALTAGLENGSLNA